MLVVLVGGSSGLGCDCPCECVVLSAFIGGAGPCRSVREILSALGRTTRRWFFRRRFRPVVSPLLLPRLVLSRSCSTLQLPWAVCPLGT